MPSCHVADVIKDAGKVCARRRCAQRLRQQHIVHPILQAQRCKGRVGQGGHHADHRIDVATERLDSPAVEEGHVVLERAGDRLSVVAYPEREIRRRRARKQDLLAYVEQSHRPAAVLHILKRKERLKQRCATHVAWRLQLANEQVEGHFRMLHGVEHLGAGCLQQRTRRHRSRRAESNDQRVHEESDQCLRIDRLASAHGRTDQQILLTSHARQDDSVGGEQHQIRRGARLECEAAQRRTRLA